MKFSIIIAAYNLGELICDAIESCINQVNISSTEFEIITINDGSTDNTLDYINRYRNIKNHIIINKSNGGLSQTRNYGIKQAKGDYILFLDGDDWLATDALSKLLNHSTIKYDVIAFPMLYYYDENNLKQKLFLVNGTYSNEKFINLTIGKKLFNIIPAPKKIYRRSFLLENNIFFIEGILHEDNPFFIDVMSICKEILFINEPIYIYRQNREGSITSVCNIKNFEGTIKGIEHIKKTHIAKNSDVQFLISNLYVFQAIGNYSSKKEKQLVYKYYRSLNKKIELVKLLFTAKFDIKAFICNTLLAIDPAFLNYVIHKL